MLSREGHRGEPDALTAHVRFWEGATLNRSSRSFMLNLKERARSTHPQSWYTAHFANRSSTPIRGYLEGSNDDSTEICPGCLPGRTGHVLYSRVRFLQPGTFPKWLGKVPKSLQTAANICYSLRVVKPLEKSVFPSQKCDFQPLVD